MIVHQLTLLMVTSLYYCNLESWSHWGNLFANWSAKNLSNKKKEVYGNPTGAEQSHITEKTEEDSNQVASLLNNEFPGFRKSFFRVVKGSIALKPLLSSRQSSPEAKGQGSTAVSDWIYHNVFTIPNNWLMIPQHTWSAAAASGVLRVLLVTGIQLVVPPVSAHPPALSSCSLLPLQQLHICLSYAMWHLSVPSGNPAAACHSGSAFSSKKAFTATHIPSLILVCQLKIPTLHSSPGCSLGWSQSSWQWFRLSKYGRSRVENIA